MMQNSTLDRNVSDVTVPTEIFVYKCVFMDENQVEETELNQILKLRDPELMSKDHGQ